MSIPNLSEAGRSALRAGIRCIACFDSKGNGYCGDHALAAILAVMQGQDPDEVAMQLMEAEADRAED